VTGRLAAPDRSAPSTRSSWSTDVLVVIVNAHRIDLGPRRLAEIVDELEQTPSFLLGVTPTLGWVLACAAGTSAAALTPTVVAARLAEDVRGAAARLPRLDGVEVEATTRPLAARAVARLLTGHFDAALILSPPRSTRQARGVLDAVATRVPATAKPISTTSSNLRRDC
jgi:hypothetical protein